MTQLNMEYLKNKALQLVRNYLPKNIIDKFEDPNNRLIIAITFLQYDYRDLAYNLFSTIACEGPKENPNHQFAYVRSLIEMAEIDADRSFFQKAEAAISLALEALPDSMNYMVSRVHIEVYLTHYQFQLGKKEEAMKRISLLCQREINKFHSYTSNEAYSLVGPGLCYSIHQWALFFVQEGFWEEAVKKIKELIAYTPSIQKMLWEEAQGFERENELKKAFYCYERALNYAQTNE